MNSQQPSKRARQLRASRLAAVQAVYSIHIAGHDRYQVIDAFRHNGHKALLQYNDGQEDLYYDQQAPDQLETDFRLFRKLVEIATNDWDSLLIALNAALQKNSFDGNLPEREPLLMAIIIVGVGELSFEKPQHHIRIINEYVALAASFYTDKQAGLVNHLLDAYCHFKTDP